MGTQEMHATNNQESDTLMRSEAQRLTTFRSWPHNDKVEARKIAKAGFFHTGNSDSEVKCLWCGTILNNWEYGDQVMARHRSANPECPFIRNISDNVPLLNDTPQVTSQSESEDNEGKPGCCGFYYIKISYGVKKCRFNQFNIFLAQIEKFLLFLVLKIYDI